ncbi:hypothetical protein NMY22_g18774 [Coprinellus aureogranulatus]|nr:hypothetical protein NMY22_g18774 [Coprinellus aureogranulatus]
MREAFLDYTPLTGATIKGVGPELAVVNGIGSVIVNFKVGDKTITHKMKDMLHVPGAPNCLVCLSCYDNGGGDVHFKDGCCILSDKAGNIVRQGWKADHLYRLNARAVLRHDQANLATPTGKSWDGWHRIFGHIGMSTLEKMHTKNVVTGFEADESSIPSRTCTSCLEAKLTRLPFPKQAESRAKRPGEGYPSDVWGPICTSSIGGYRYYISFTDNCTRMVKLKEKDEASDKIAQQVAWVENQFGKLPQWICFDNGKELVNEKMKLLCASKGVEIHTTALYSPSQNGVAERLNRTLLDLTQAMLIAKGLPAYLWDGAVNHAVYL